MRVLIVERQSQVCSALKLLLEQEAGLQVVGEAADQRALGALLAQRTPDLILLDWGLAHGNARRWIAALREGRPGLKVIALSGRGEARQAAMDAGVDAFVSKVDPPERLLQALAALGKGLGDTCARPPGRGRSRVG